MTDAALQSIAAAYGTPTFVFDADALQARVRAIEEIFGPDIAPVSYTHLDVYKRQEKGTVFLPQLLQAATAAQAAFEAIKAKIAASGQAQGSKGKIVIATVSYTHLDVYKRQAPRRAGDQGRVGGAQAGRPV